MNRPLPPGDCGHPSSAPRRPFRAARIVLGAFGLVSGVATDPVIVCATCRLPHPTGIATVAPQLAHVRAGGGPWRYWPTEDSTTKKPTAAGAGRAYRGGRAALLVDPVRALPTLGLERLDGISSLLHRAGHEAADGVFLPAELLHDLRQGRAPLALQQRHDLSCLRRGPTRNGRTRMIRMRGSPR